MIKSAGVDADIQNIAAVLKVDALYDPYVAAVTISGVVPAMNDPSLKHKVIHEVVKDILIRNLI